jgi:hypothetical protein
VIQVTTKKGRAGRTRWDAFGEGGTLKDINDYPLNTRSYGHTSTGALVTNCSLFRRTSGLPSACVAVDSSVSNNPLESSGIESVGNRRLTGLSVTGGSDLAAYFVSGEYQREQNVIDINHQQRLNLRTNLRSQVTSTLDMQVNVGYTNSDLRRPQKRQQLVRRRVGVAPWPRGGLQPTGAKLHPGLCTNGADTVSHGYYNQGIAPTDFFNINTRQEVQRLIGGLTSNWTPKSWFSMNATIGADVDHRNDNETLPPAVLTVDQDRTDGYRSYSARDHHELHVERERLRDVRLRPLQVRLDVRHAVHRRWLYAHRCVRRKAAVRHGLVGWNNRALCRERNQQ